MLSRVGSGGKRPETCGVRSGIVTVFGTPSGLSPELGPEWSPV